MATEKRLIDAYAFYKKFANDTPAIIMGEQRYVATWRISDLIAEAPTVDAVEVVHGRWEDMYDGKYANPRYRCSVCKEKTIYLFNRNSLGNWEEVQAKTNYCPHCGAKMDGDGNA